MRPVPPAALVLGSLLSPLLLPSCARHETRIYPLAYEDAAAAAEVIASMDGRGSGIRRSASVARTNVVVVQATERGHADVTDLLMHLDVSVEDGGPALVVIYLEEHRAEALLPVLRELWPESELSIAADARANALVVRGSAWTMREVREVVGRLDVAEERLVGPGLPGGEEERALMPSTP